MIIIAIKLRRKVNWGQLSTAEQGRQWHLFVWLTYWSVFREGTVHGRSLSHTHPYEMRESYISTKNCGDGGVSWERGR